MTIQLIPVSGLPEVAPGDDLAALICEHAAMESGDVVVVTQKVVSKAEGRLVAVDPDDPVSHKVHVEAEAVRVLRRRGDLIMTETSHGFVCANSGVDLSNVAAGWAALLPIDPDRSARWIRDGIRARTGLEIGVIVSDTFGRPWRIGIVNVALGLAGLPATFDLRGTVDDAGQSLHATVLAIADDIAAAAGIVMGKTSRIPAVIVRGFHLEGAGAGRDLIRPVAEDLFR